jgi:hypothetical protein
LNVLTNQCQCPPNFELVNGQCKCNLPYGGSTACLAHNCQPPLNFFSRFYSNGAYYQSNATAANEYINEAARYYGNGDPSLELVELCRTFFNFSFSNFGCVFEGSCNNKQAGTFYFYFNSIEYYECINCPADSSITDNVCCPQNQTNVNGICQCAPTFVWNSNNASQCVCPANTFYNGTCNCLPGFARDPNSGRCVCPPGYQLNNCTCVPLKTESGNCVCPENEYYDYTLKKCRCIDGYYRDPMTEHCLIECIYCGEFEVYNSTVEACVCIPGYVRVTPQANCTIP